MSDGPLIRFEIKILNRVYPILIHPEEQDVVEDVQRVINEKMSEITHKYSGQDLIDITAMAFISYAFEVQKKKIEQEKLDKTS